MQRRPTGRQTDAERLAARGFTAEKINAQVASIDPSAIYSSVSTATQTAQDRLEKRLWAYVKVLDSKTFPNMEYAKVLDAGSEAPLEFWCGFLDYLVMVGQGQISDMVTVGTMRTKLGVLLGLVPRRTHLKIASQLSRKLYNYVSGELKQKYDLRDDVRVKKTADTVDVFLLQRELWELSYQLRSTRMIVQVSVFLNIACRAGSRPGCVVESSAYKGSNEALYYGAINFTVIPSGGPIIDHESGNSTTSRSATVVTEVQFDYLKGMRNDPGKFTSVVFVMEALRTGFANCTCSQLLYLALQDDVFENIHSLDDLKRLMLGTRTNVTLRMKETARKLPVLRAFVDGKVDQHTISDTLAMSYNSLAYQCGRLGQCAGFSDKFSSYSLRRMVANNFDESDSSSELRKQVMGHKNFSRIFSAYQSSLIRADLSAIAEGREQDKSSVRAVGRLSKDADRNAPFALSPEGAQEVYNVPEVQELRRAHEAKRNVCLLKYGTLQNAIGTQEAADCKAAWKVLSNVYRREARLIFGKERAAYFANADKRILDSLRNDEAVSASGGEEVEPVTLLPDDEETDLSQFDLAARQQVFGQIDFNEPTPDDMETMVPITTDTWTPFVVTTCTPPDSPLSNFPPDLYTKLFKAATLSETNDSASAWIDMMHYAQSIPLIKEVYRVNLKIRSYPGEEPRSDGRCSVCDDQLVEQTASDQAKHLHACAMRRRQTTADEAYALKHSETSPCGLCGCLFQSDLGTRVHHIQACAKKRTRGEKGRKRDKWECGFCDENGACSLQFSSMSAYLIHLEDDHGAAALGKGHFEFCLSCHQTLNSREEWENHLAIHFHDELAPTGEQPSRPISYATQVNTGLVQKPGLCPECVWDEQKPFSVRMHQSRSFSLLAGTYADDPPRFPAPNGPETHFVRVHLPGYLAACDQDLSRIAHRCPARECSESSTSFDLLGLLNHLITEHQMAFGGKRRRKDGQIMTLDNWNELTVRPGKDTPEWKALGLKEKSKGKNKLTTESARKKENSKRPAADISPKPELSPKPVTSGRKVANPSNRPKKRGKH